MIYQFLDKKETIRTEIRPREEEVRLLYYERKLASKQII